MNPVRSGPRSLLLAVVATGILAAAGPVCAQQPAANPAPPARPPVPPSA
jgi:hypothetical protein